MTKWILLCTIFCVSFQSFSQSLTLDINSYTDSVLNYSLQILQSKANTNALQEAMKLAKTSYFPKLLLSGQVQYNFFPDEIKLSEITKFEMSGLNYGASLILEQPIYNGGSIDQTYKVSQIQHKIGQESEALTLDNVLYSARTNYWTTAAKKDLYKAMCRYVDIVSSMETILKTRFKDGLISKTDYLQMAARLKDAETQKIETYKLYKISLQNLNVMMGKRATDSITMQDSISIKIVLPLQSLSLDSVLERRPDYNISLHTIDYQKRQVALATSKYNPSVVAGIKETFGTKSLNIDDSGIFGTIAYLSLRVPIFEWGARNKAAASQKARVKSAVLDKAILVDNVEIELNKSWTELTQTTQQIVVADSSRTIAQENLDINTFSYNEGKLPVIDLLTAQLAWIQAQSNYISTLLQQKIAIVSYQKAISE